MSTPADYTTSYLPVYVMSEDVPAATYTASVFLLSLVGGTITLQLSHTVATEVYTLVCTLTAANPDDLQHSWQRFAFAGHFTGTAGGTPVLTILRGTGDLSEVRAWGANISTNPTDDSQIVLFPYRRRIAETIDTNSVRASRCLASDAGVGARCSYTPATCQDLPNFNFGNEYESEPQNGLKTMRFCNKEAALPLPGEKVRPYVEEAAFAAQEIYPDRSVTISDRAAIRFFDDHEATENINQNHASLGELTNTDVPRGSFWRRFLAMWPNYANPVQTVKVFECFAPTTLDQLQLRGTYVMVNASLTSKGQFTLTLNDRLKLLRTKAPFAISDSNRVVGLIDSSQTVITFTDTSELTPLPGTSRRASPLLEISTGEYPVVIEIDFDNANAEFMNVTRNALDLSQLTVQRGRWGSTAKTHGDQAKWREVLMCGTENATPSDPVLGKNGINIVLELLARGLGNLVDVDTARFLTEKTNWVDGDVIANKNTGIVFKRAGGPSGVANSGITSPTDIEVLLRSLRDTLNLDIFINELGKVSGKIFAPPLATENPPKIGTQQSFIEDTWTMDDNQELSRFNRVIFATNLTANGNDTTITDYQDFITYVGLDDELPFFYGAPKTKVVLSPWVIAGDSKSASTLAAHIYPRYHKPIRKMTVDFEIKDDAIQVGDYVLATWDEITTPMGDPILDRFGQVLRKARDFATGKFTLLIYDLGQLDRYWILGPDTNSPDYDTATEAERRYGYLCDENGRIGSKNDPGYRMW